MGLGRGIVVIWIVCLSPLVLVIPPAEAVVLEGAFRIFDPDDPRGREGDLLSLGPIVAGAARLRTSQPDAVSGPCSQLVLVMLGSKVTKRKPDGAQVQQKGDVVAFFVVTECIGEDSVCVVDASEPVSIPDCSGAIKLTTKRGVSGKVKFRCKRGIDVGDAAFGLGAAAQQILAADFPDLTRKLKLSFRDKAAERLTQADFDEKIEGLGVDALDDVVGTYLADDALPLCN